MESPNNKFFFDKDSDKYSELNLNILEEHFEEINVDPVLDNKEQVENLIKRYIKIIRLDCTDELLKNKMIKKLCELRVRQCELIEEQELNSISGHQLKLETTTNYCDICMKKQNGYYIPILNNLSTGQLNVCIYCNYSIHVECQAELFTNKKIRECPKLIHDRQIAAQNNLHSFVILDICVEKALSEQEYKCNDCKELINFETSSLCDYDGHYYCRNCHNNDLSVIPARVIHNWDFVPRSVSKNSFYILNFIKNKPKLFNLLELNSMLYGFIDELPIVKRLRYDLNLMVKYIILCKQPNKPKITISNHLINSEQINLYSLSDLQDLPTLKKNLSDFHSKLYEHITKNCETCKGNGFYCELCVDKGGILFPFLSNISMCPKCHAVFHKTCYYRKKVCKRCKRIEKKEAESVAMTGMDLRTVINDLRLGNESVDDVDNKLKLDNSQILNQLNESNLSNEEDKENKIINQMNESNEFMNEENNEISDQTNESNENNENNEVNEEQLKTNHGIIKAQFENNKINQTEDNQNAINQEKNEILT